MADMMISFAKKGIEHTNNLKKKALSQGTKRKGSIDPFSSVVPPLVEDIVKFIEEYGSHSFSSHPPLLFSSSFKSPNKFININ